MKEVHEPSILHQSLINIYEKLEYILACQAHCNSEINKVQDLYSTSIICILIRLKSIQET